MDFTHYLTRLGADLKAGNATEHTHRPALQTLLESGIPGIKATNEPRRIAYREPVTNSHELGSPPGIDPGKADCGVSGSTVHGPLPDC